MSLRTLLVLTLLMSATSVAQAQTRAWLDRDRIEMGETATLNVESTEAGAQPPDYDALVPDFVLSGHSSRRSYEVSNGQRRARVLYGVALSPRREGVVTIPALRVGNATTAPLTLTVLPASTAPARAGEPAFIETETDSRQPYVQQSISHVIRLHYATPLVSGTLDQPAPEGASMQRIGSDLQYSRDIAGRSYTVVERRYQIVPERSGPLTIPAARFNGRGVGGFFDDLLGGGARELRASSAAQVLQVQPMPDGATQPWLPLHGLTMRYVAAPTDVRAGEAATIEIEAIADGAVGAQLPALELSIGSGAQVFAERQQVDETFDNGRLRTRVVRRFSVVPAQPGALHVPGPRMGWWDVQAGTARTASLPDLQWQVAPGSGTPASTATIDGGRYDVDARGHGAAVPWPWIAAVFALLWIVTLGWALRCGTARPWRSTRVAPTPSAPATPQDAAPSKRQWLRLVQTGDLGEVAEALCAMATPPVRDLDALMQRLDDPAQREAIALLQQARWNNGDAAAARAALQAAFARGAIWKTPPATLDNDLPPLYPANRHAESHRG